MTALTEETARALIEKIDSLTSDEAKAEDLKAKLLLSSYSDNQKSLDLMHDRMDKLSQAYLISIGAIFTLFFLNQPKVTPLVILAAPAVAIFATFQLRAMWHVARTWCAVECKIEREIFGPDDLTNRPAHVAFFQFYSRNKTLTPDLNYFEKANFRESGRASIWLMISIFSIIFCVVVFENLNVAIIVDPPETPFKIMSGAEQFICEADRLGTVSCKETDASNGAQPTK